MFPLCDAVQKKKKNTTKHDFIVYLSMRVKKNIYNNNMISLYIVQQNRIFIVYIFSSTLIDGKSRVGGGTRTKGRRSCRGVWIQWSRHMMVVGPVRSSAHKFGVGSDMRRW